jgi:hypothetical protein
MSVKRPRLPEDLSDRIDKARGLVPFEAYVRDALEPAVQLAEGDRTLAVERLIKTVPPYDLLHDVFMESFGYHWPEFQPALDRLRAEWEQNVRDAEADADSP